MESQKINIRFVVGGQVVAENKGVNFIGNLYEFQNVGAANYIIAGDSRRYFQHMLSARKQRGPMILVATEPGRMGATHYVSRSHVKYWRKAYRIAFKESPTQYRPNVNAITSNKKTPKRLWYFANETAKENLTLEQRSRCVTLCKETVSAMRRLRIENQKKEQWPMLPAPYVPTLSEKLELLWAGSAERIKRKIDADIALAKRRLSHRYNALRTTDYINSYILLKGGCSFVTPSVPLFEVVRQLQMQGINAAPLFTAINNI